MTEKEKPTIYEFYESVLKAAGHVVEPETGRVLQAFTSNRPPATIGGKELVLPLASLLRDPDPDKQIFFHPLCEQLPRHESDVFQYLKRCMILKLMTSFVATGTSLIKLQEDPALQRKMNFEQMDVMKNIEINEKSSYKTALTHWYKMVMGEVEQNGTRMDKWPITIHLKRNGHHNGKNYLRVAVVGFPIFEKLFAGHRFTKDGPTGPVDVYREKDYGMFKQVAKAIFPEIGNPDSTVYNVGYSGTLAPYFVTFLRAYKELANRLNFLLELFREPLASIGEDVTISMIDTSWGRIIDEEDLSTLSSISRGIPSLVGNTGNVNGAEPVEEKAKDKSSEERARAPEKKAEPRPEPKAEVKEPQTTMEEMSSDLLEAMERKRLWKEEQAKLEEDRRYREESRSERDDRERRERRAREDEEDRRAEERRRDERRSERDDRDRDYRDSRDRRDDRDRDRRDDDRNRGRDREVKKTAEGFISMNDVYRHNPDMERDRDEDRRHREREERDRRYDRDRDYRDSRDRGYRDRRDDRGYRDDYRDRRDDRGYRGGDRRGGRSWFS